MPAWWHWHCAICRIGSRAGRQSWPPSSTSNSPPTPLTHPIPSPSHCTLVHYHSDILQFIKTRVKSNYSNNSNPSYSVIPKIIKCGILNSPVEDSEVCLTKQTPWHSTDGVWISVTLVSSIRAITRSGVYQQMSGAGNDQVYIGFKWSLI